MRIKGWRRVAAALAFTTAQALAGQGQSAPPPRPSRERVIEVARQIMVAARYCTLVTIGPKGQPQARIVDPLEPDSSLAVYIATNPRSRKVEEIKRDSRVTLVYFDTSRSGYVTMIGRARVVGGATKAQHHKTHWDGFFDSGKPDSYVLYQIAATRIEVVSAKDGIAGDALTWRPDAVEIR